VLIVPDMPVAPADADVAPDVPVAPAVADGEDGVAEGAFADAGFVDDDAVCGFADVAGFDGFVDDSVFTEGAIEPLLEAVVVVPPADCSNCFRCVRNSTSFARIAGSIWPAGVVPVVPVGVAG
jgi:hypothetical protein